MRSKPQICEKRDVANTLLIWKRKTKKPIANLFKMFNLVRWKLRKIYDRLNCCWKKGNQINFHFRKESLVIFPRLCGNVEYRTINNLEDIRLGNLK